jgi:hypothetical protein
MMVKTKSGAQKARSERPRCIGAAGSRIRPLIYSTPKKRQLATIRQKVGWVPKLVWMWWWEEKYQPSPPLPPGTEFKILQSPNL